jgi:hypothetical protein
LEAQKTASSQGNTEQKSNAGGVTIPNYKLYYRAIAIKIAWYWHENKYEASVKELKTQIQIPASLPILFLIK